MSSDDVALLAHTLSRTLTTGAGPSSATTQKTDTKSRFAETIERSDLTIFKDVEDLGFHQWTPIGRYKKIKDLQPLDILQRITLNTEPPTLVSLHSLNSKLPLAFSSKHGKGHVNEFPYNHTYLAPLYVAVNKRGVNLDNIDFIFGGSTLNFLATTDVPEWKKYLAAFVPGSTTILVAKHHKFHVNLTDIGYQFERFVTGGNFDDKPDSTIFEHMQLMTVGKYRVMFCAESDAIDANGDAVEIKASNPRYWGFQLMFQMISSGSATLCGATKSGNTLTAVREQTLSDLIAKKCRGEQVFNLENNVLKAMHKLKAAADEGVFEGEKTFVIGFDDNGLTLQPSEEHNCLFPPKDVVVSLVESSHSP